MLKSKLPSVCISGLSVTGLCLALAFTASAYITNGKAKHESVLPASTGAQISEPSGEEKIEWLTIEEAAERAKKHPRKIIVDVYTNWCGWCKRMDKATFGDAAVAKYVSEHFYAVKFNAESPDNVIFKDEVYRFNPQNKANDLAVKWLQGQMGYPTIVYLDEKLNTIQAMGGYKGPEEYPAILEYFKTNAYKKKSYEEYSRAK